MISRRDVAHIAHLARIELSDAETAKVKEDLTGILAFVDKLSELDTSMIAPLTGGTNLENVLREDAMSEKGSANNEQAKDLVASSPRKRGGFIEVHSVFERP